LQNMFVAATINISIRAGHLIDRSGNGGKMRVLLIILTVITLASCSISKARKMAGEAQKVYKGGGSGEITFAGLIGLTDNPTFYPNGKVSPETIADINIEAVSNCHAGDLDMGEKNFWKDVKVAAAGNEYPELDRENLVDTDENTVFTLSIETFDGRVMGSKKLIPGDIVVKEQLTQNKRKNNVLHSIPVKILPGLANGEAFPVSLFVCVDANDDGRCADEAIVDINGVVNANPPGTIIDAPVDQPEVPKGKLLQSVQMMAAYRNGELIFQDMKIAQMGPGSIIDTTRENGSAERAQETNEVVQDYLKNLKHSDPAKADDPLAIAFAVEAKDAPACQPPPPAAPPVHHVRTNGCFIAGTVIELPGGKKQLVEKIFKGTEVLTADKHIATATRSVAGPEIEPVIEIKSAAGHTLTVTKKHPVLTKAGMKLAQDIQLADSVIGRDMKPIKIISIKKKVYKGIVYNFALPGKAPKGHMVIADGLVVGDLYVQEKMSAK
jgi:hypothetical protein